MENRKDRDNDWRYEFHKFPVKKPTMRFDIIGTESDLQIGRILAETEEAAITKYKSFFGRDSGYGYTVNEKTTHLVFARMYLPYK